MSLEPSYVDRVMKQYNKRHACVFCRKWAEKKFLHPWGFALDKSPSQNFEKNKQRMTDKEEFDLFAAIHFMKYIIFHEQLSPQHIDIYIALRNRGISANYGLVFECFRRYSSVPLRDVKDPYIEAGYFALIAAVDSFDPWRGFKMSTYACNSIFRKFSYTSKQNSKRHNELVGEEEIEFEKNDEQNELWKECLERCLCSDLLDIVEKTVIAFRFGCLGVASAFPDRKFTLEDVGKIIGFSKEHVRTLQNRSIAKIRKELSMNTILNPGVQTNE